LQTDQFPATLFSFHGFVGRPWAVRGSNFDISRLFQAFFGPECGRLGKDRRNQVGLKPGDGAEPGLPARDDFGIAIESGVEQSLGQNLADSFDVLLGFDGVRRHK